MKQKPILILAAVVLVLILVAEGVFLLRIGNRNPADQLEQHESEPTAPQTTTAEATQPSDTEAAAPSTTAPEETLPETMTAQPTQQPELPQTQPPVIPPADPEPVETEPVRISLPYRISGTDLVIEALNSYDGIFLEDGSDEEVQGIAAIIVRNTGSSCVEFVKVSMNGERCQYQFEASGIGAGQSIVIMEHNRAAAIDQKYIEIRAELAQVDQLELSEDSLKIEELESGALRITNVTEKEIPCVRVFYKYYMEEKSVYVGGITYTVKLLNLKAGGSADITPSHYIAGSSRVIMAKTYELEES